MGYRNMCLCESNDRKNNRFKKSCKKCAKPVFQINMGLLITLMWAFCWGILAFKTSDMNNEFKHRFDGIFLSTIFFMVFILVRLAVIELNMPGCSSRMSVPRCRYCFSNNNMKFLRSIVDFFGFSFLIKKRASS